jgi:hypothetical protein
MNPNIPVSDGILLAVALMTTGDKLIDRIKPAPGAFSFRNKKESGSKVISGIR